MYSCFNFGRETKNALRHGAVKMAVATFRWNSCFAFSWRKQKLGPPPLSLHGTAQDSAYVLALLLLLCPYNEPPK